eukprot:1296344-Karenia_brevis.AAC.1
MRQPHTTQHPSSDGQRRCYPDFMLAALLSNPPTLQVDNKVLTKFLSDLVLDLERDLKGKAEKLTMFLTHECLFFR